MERRPDQQCIERKIAMNRSLFTLPKPLRTVSTQWGPPLAALLFFVMAAAAFAQSTPRCMSIAQPVAGALLSFLVVATFCWEWKLFGNPRRLPVFAAHLGFFLAVFFLVNALLAPDP
jgi:hypothetical protein